MAVEIPVVIDIDAAFTEAAKRVGSAIGPLKQSIEDNTAKIKLKIGEEWDDVSQKLVPIKKSLEDIVGLTAKFNAKTGKTTYSLTANIQELSVALEDAKNKYGQLSAKEEKGLQVDYQKLDAYREAITVLMSEISLRQRNVGLVEKATLAEINRVNAIDEGNYALIQETKTMSQLSDKISALRGKLDNLNPSKDKKEWGATAKEIEKATAAYEKLKAKLQVKPKAGSIEYLTAEMTKLEQKWNSMSKRQKFDENGQLKASAQKLVDKFKQLTAESEKYGQSLAKAAGVAKPGIDATTNSLRSQSVVLGQLTSMAASYVSVFGLLRLAKQVRDVTGELEYQRVALGRLLKDVSYGNYLFERTKEAAIESPFRIKDLVTYTKQLAAYRIEQENLFHTSKRLADISAGLGVEMSRLILAYGQVRAASVLRGQELRQFTEAGIPLVEMLSEKFTDLRGEMVSTGDVFKLISERAVPFSMIADIFEDLTEKGGMFYKMQEEQAKTLKGRWEKLKDAFDIALQSVGDTTTFQKENDIVLSALTKLAGNLRVIIKLMDAAVISVAAYNAVMLVTTKRVAATATAEQAAAIAEAMRSRNVSGLIVKIMGQVAAEKALVAATEQSIIGTTRLSRALGKLKVAILTNPWGIAAAAVLGLVLALTRFKKATDDSYEAIKNLNKAADDLHAEFNRQERISKLISLYEKLSSEQERNAAQNESLTRTMKKLSGEFPEYKERIEDTNLSLEERLKLVKDLNEEEEKRLKRMMDEKKEELKANETKLSYATKDLNAAEQAKIDATVYYNQLQEQLDNLSESGKGPRGFWGKIFLQSSEYEDVWRALVMQRKQLDQTEADYNKAEEAVDGLTKAIERLKEELYGSQEEGSEALKSWKEQLQKMQNTAAGVQLFTPEQLENWHRLYDVSNDLEKEWKKLKEDIAGLEAGLDNARQTGSDTINEWEKDLASANDKLAGLDLIREFFKFVWGKKEKQPRDTRLSDLKKDIDEITNAYKKYTELRKYFGKDRALIEIDALFPQLKGWEPTFDQTISRLKEKLDGVKAKLTKSPKDRVLLDMQRTLETEISNLKFDALKKKIDDEMKQVSDDIKRGTAARDLFRSLLDLTGDQDFATNLTVSVYGDIGDELKDRVKKQLDAAFETFDASDYDLWDKMRIAIADQDWNFILKNLDKFGDGWDKIIKQMSEDTEKYNKDTVEGYAKLLMQFDELRQQEVDITNKANKEKLTLEEGLEKQIAAMRAQNASEEEIESAKARVNLAKWNIEADTKARLNALSSDYRLFFNTVDVISIETARKIANEQKNLLAGQLAAQKITFKEYQREIKAINDHLKQYENKKGYFLTWLTEGLDGLLKKISDEAESLNGIIPTLTRENFKGGVFTPGEDAEKFLSRYDKLLNRGLFSKIFKKDPQITLRHKIELAASAAYTKSKDGGNPNEIAEAEAMKAGMEALGGAASEMGSAAAEGAEAAAWIEFWVKNAYQTIKGLDDRITNAGEKEASEIMNFFAGPLRYLAGKAGIWDKGDETWDKLAAVNTHAMDFIEAMKNGDFGNALFAVYDALYDLWGPNQRKIKREIKEQVNLVNNLEYEYSRLEVAIDKAFGSDYISNYNQQLTVLQAKVDAYKKQAELERSKGKKADEDTAKGYEKSARDVEDQIADMQSQLSEFMSGTDLTSAAKEFAEAWIEAYKEFGSTTDAMKEKFNDMIQNMVVNSLAAQLIQSILKPIFDQIDEAARSEGVMTAAEIAGIAAQIPGVMDQIDGAMTGLITQLTSAGLNLRSQAGSFTGISRDIATASEESVTGLAAGINTQNFYISHIDANVAAILSAITGGASTPGASVTGEYVDPYKDFVMQNIDLYFPSFDRKLGDILNRLDRVIRPRTDRPEYVVHTNL